MKTRTLHTSFNLLIEPTTYQRLKMAARLQHTPMSKIVREGMNLILAKIDKKNNAITEGGQE